LRVENWGYHELGHQLPVKGTSIVEEEILRCESGFRVQGLRLTAQVLCYGIRIQGSEIRVSGSIGDEGSRCRV